MSIVPAATPELDANGLRELGLEAGEARGLFETVTFERPAYLFDLRRVKSCSLGAFSYVNGLNTTSLYDARIGRYCSIAPEVMIGSNEHPVDWLTSSRVTHVADLHDWARFCAPDRVDEIRRQRVPFKDACKITTIGNDVWIGQGVFIKAGVTIGDGAIVAGRSVVVKDVPAYSIVAGTPATVKRMRFPEATVERLVRLQWWRYSIFDLFGLPFDRIDEALDGIEEKIASGAIKEYTPVKTTPEDLVRLFEPIPLAAE